LTDVDRIDKHVALVLIAIVWTYKVGVSLNSFRSIKIKKQGKKIRF